jgi:hypothetical protein
MTKNIIKGFIICGVLSTLSSCIDYEDASRLVNIRVHLNSPVEYMADAALSNQEVKIKSDSDEKTAITDENGIATFENCMPDVYDISSYKELTKEEYTEKTGNPAAAEGYSVTAGLSEQLCGEGQENTPIEVESSLIIKDFSIVISKIYCAGSKAYPEQGGKSYMSGKYLELYNQSADSVDISGLYIGLLDSTNPQPYTMDNLMDDPAIQGTKLVAKQVFQIPTDKEYKVAGGEAVLLCNSAVDHSDVSDYEYDLSNADFEAVGTNDNLEHNEKVAKLITAYTSSGGAAIMNLVQSGPCGIIIFKTDEDITTWEKVYGYGKTSGPIAYLLIPKDLVKDGVDYVKNSKTGPSISTKRIYTDIDAGYTFINAISGWSGEVVYRNTASVTPDGRKVLMDTNNSSNDFKVSTTIKPREYDEE